MDAPKIAFLSPVSESVSVPAFKSALAACLSAMDNGLKITQVGVTERVLVHQARNMLALEFLKTDCEWAFWWDCDTIMPPTVISRLYKTAADCDSKFVTGIYYQRNGRHLPCIWSKAPVLEDGTLPQYMHKPGKGPDYEAYRHFHVFPGQNNVNPFKVDVCGFGCVLTHRDVIADVVKLCGNSPFKMITDTCSEDFYFCVHAKKAGYQLWADPVPNLGHIGQANVVYKTDMRVDQNNAMPILSKEIMK